MPSTLAPLRLRTAERGEVRVLSLEGRLDETFEGLLAGTFQRLLDAKQVRVIVDLGRLDFLNSRGVSAFIAAVDEFRASGGDLKIAAAPAQARVVLERLGIDKLIQHFDTVDGAADAFQIPIEEFLSEGGLDMFVSGPRGKTFHASRCSKVKRIRSVRILASKKAAREAGLKPCPRCCG